jgi:hypothetical protein
MVHLRIRLLHDESLAPSALTRWVRRFRREVTDFGYPKAADGHRPQMAERRNPFQASRVAPSAVQQPTERGPYDNHHSSPLSVKNDATVVTSSAAAQKASWPCFCASTG